MCVWQPSVEWEHRNLDGEADEHSGEDPNLRGARDIHAVLNEERNREALGACLEEQCKERDQHECRSEHRVQEELERCVLAIFATPYADHEVHRKQNEFEEHEEQNKIASDECSGHADLQDEHEDEEGLRIAR